MIVAEGCGYPCQRRPWTWPPRATAPPCLLAWRCFQGQAEWGGVGTCDAKSTGEEHCCWSSPRCHRGRVGCVLPKPSARDDRLSFLSVRSPAAVVAPTCSARKSSGRRGNGSKKRGKAQVRPPPATPPPSPCNGAAAGKRSAARAASHSALAASHRRRMPLTCSRPTTATAAAPPPPRGYRQDQVPSRQRVARPHATRTVHRLPPIRRQCSSANQHGRPLACRAKHSARRRLADTRLTPPSWQHRVSAPRPRLSCP